MAETMPDLTLTDDSGEPKALADYKGKPLVLFFFPRANTPGCTKESIAFSEMLEDFKSSGAAVAGVSKDSPKKLSNFREKQDLTVDLLSDAETDLSERLGVWKEKQMYGKSFMGLERSTFLYGADGKLLRDWRKVKVKGHAEAVLEALREAA
ncbi:peroxiredoxin [Novosphingopyxis sp. YJ-S2-01]|uniref:peroxiredoxin n=1 Tax=Novosphingopyxis sp. YJ-S2-01 TaxID=2794021 RepID=UPI0018DE4597|nr:peroxiredoxin [Novosphingopyxis sp. YJ-S2-01]MBH9538372.1 peroxiredoxin [Novosphingopyxis sp. YJ-S2-01]